MTKSPLVTIVTPSFNQAQFLEKTIRSVIRQDYPHIEYIVIDGGSTDGSVDIIKKYEKHIAYWVSEPDNGQSNAINKGFAKARGSILAWLNSDDLLAPSAVRIAAHYLSLNPDIGLVYGNRLHIDRKGNVVGINRCPTHDQNMFKKNFTIPQETAFFRREIFEAVGRLDESLHFAMDFDLWCRVAKVTRMHHAPAFMGYFREHAAAKSVAFHDILDSVSDKYQEEHARVFRNHFNHDLPSPLMMKWYRLLRQLKILLEQKSTSRRQEMQMLRQLISEGETV
jgi:glycosyltransferase involved in cell wall biosynthesis